MEHPIVEDSYGLKALSDGSFVSLSDHNILYRWVTTVHHQEQKKEEEEEEEEEKDDGGVDDDDDDNDSNDDIWEDHQGGGNRHNKLIIVGRYEGHREDVFFAEVLGDDRLITASCNDSLVPTPESILKVWNKTTGECLETISLGPLVSTLLKMRDGTTLLCGFENGSLQFLRTSDFRVMKTIQIQEKDKEVRGEEGKEEEGEEEGTYLTLYCELEDGTFILGFGSQKFQRWDIPTETALQTFTGHDDGIYCFIEIKRDIIVSTSDQETIIWRVSTGECLHKLTSEHKVMDIAKLSGGCFARATKDFEIQLWTAYGHNYAIYGTAEEVRSMISLVDGSLVTFEDSIRRKLLVIVKQ